MSLSLSLFYIIFPIIYQSITAFTYGILFPFFSNVRPTPLKYLITIAIASCIFYIAFFLVITLFKGHNIAAGLFPSLTTHAYPAWKGIIRGTWWYYVSNILAHTALIKFKVHMKWKRMVSFTALCNTVSYLASLIFFAYIN